MIKFPIDNDIDYEVCLLLTCSFLDLDYCLPEAKAKYLSLTEIEKQEIKKRLKKEE